MYSTPGYVKQNTACGKRRLPAIEDLFTTEQAVAVQPVVQRLDEATLHTLFEQAINDRLEAICVRLRHYSEPITREPQGADVRCNYQQKVVTSIVSIERRSSVQRWPWLNFAWQRRIIYASLALMLVMAGFDLMGVLVLRLH